MINNEVLVEESLNLFNVKGFRVSMDELASRLRVSKRTLYEQIGNKEELILYIMEQFTKELDEYYFKVFNEEETGLKKLKKILIHNVEETWFFYQKIDSLKQEFPLVYKEYVNKIDKRWEKNFTILDMYLEEETYIDFDKNTFRVMFVTLVRETLIKYNSITNVLINEAVNKIIDVLLNGMNSSVLGKFGSLKPLKALRDFSLEVMIFTFCNGKVFSLTESGDYFKRYSGNVNENTNLLDLIDEKDRENVLNVLEKATNDDEIYELRYKIANEYDFRLHHIVFSRVNNSSGNNAFFAIISDETDSFTKNEIIRVNEERLKIAFEQADIGIWEYDAKEKSIKVSSNVVKMLGLNSDILYNVPSEEYVKDNIKEEYRESYLNFCKDIRDGEKNGNCVIQEKDHSGDYIWTKRTYKTIYDYRNKPLKSIGIIRKINNVTDIKGKFEEEEKLFKLIQNEILLAIKFDITKNKVENVINNGDLDKYSNLKGIEYSHLLNLIVENFPNDEDKEKFLSSYSYENLLAVSQTAQASIHVDYRFIGSDGSVKWLSCTGNFLTEPFTGDKYLFAYVRDIDEKTKIELSFDKKVEYDVTTRLYMESTMRALTNYLISKQKDSKKVCAMAVFEVANFFNIKVQYGLDIAEKVLFYIGRILRMCFNNKNVVGRVFDNQFAIFFPHVNDFLDIEAEVSSAIAMAQDSYSLTTRDEKIAILKVSICMADINNTHYQNLYNNCLNKLDKIRDDKDVDIIDNKKEYDNGKEKVYTYENNILVGGEIDTKILEELKHCVKLNTYDESINSILNVINNYYQADRSTIFCFDDSRKKLILKFDKKYDSNDKIDKLEITKETMPGFFNYISNGNPILINRISRIEEKYHLEYKFLKERGIDSVYIFPLIEKRIVVGFLSVCNLVSHISETRLLQHVSSILTSEIVKYELISRNNNYLERDSLTDTMNYGAFTKHLNELEESNLTSLGICSAKITGLRKINFEYGRDYGDTLIISIAKTLKEKFGDSRVFRIEGDRFIVFEADISYKKFKEQVKEIECDLNKIKENLTIVCDTWNDTDINVEQMLENIEETIEINKRREKEVSDGGVDVQYTLDYLFDNHCFEVKLQPKIDLSNNEIVGAEALTRLNHPQIGTVPPGKYIPVLERDKTIGRLDLFVLEEICKILSNWKKANKKLVPISINYSRVTLLETKIIERTLNIMRKYDIPSDLIVVEITESIGNVEQAKIAEIANDFVKNNIKLSIDDFGSKFSSLATLSIVPFCEVKLDKSIVNNLVTNKKNQIVVEYIIGMSKKMGMKVVAEGIETELQLEQLREKNCDYGQGYFFQKPMSVSEFEEKYIEK